MHVSGKEVKASDITGRQNDAKRPNVKILLNIYVPVMYLVCGKVDHPLGTEIEAISLKQSINQSINFF